MHYLHHNKLKKQLHRFAKISNLTASFRSRETIEDCKNFSRYYWRTPPRSDTTRPKKNPSSPLDCCLCTLFHNTTSDCSTMEEATGFTDCTVRRPRIVRARIISSRILVRAQIPSVSSIGRCFDELCQTKEIPNMKCRKCQKSGYCNIMPFALWNTPDIQAVHIKRHNFSRSHREKLTTSKISQLRDWT
jgi:hypothetical protein